MTPMIAVIMPPVLNEMYFGARFEKSNEGETTFAAMFVEIWAIAMMIMATINNSGVFSNPTFIESLYNYGLFFTFGVAAIAYLALSMIGGRAPEPAREPEAT